jgi:formimidoylglutamate deiminase
MDLWFGHSNTSVAAVDPRRRITDSGRVTGRYEAVFDGERWLRDVRVDVGEDGRIVAMGPAGPGAQPSGTVIPALPNLHGHAFQRAMAGRAEVRGPDPADSFWTWRARMYAEAGGLDPERLRSGATALYRELRAAGYGTVVEFHYVHQRPDGGDYATPGAMLLALVDAAEAAGVRLTLLPVLYQRAGFESPDPTPAQRRFVLSVDAYLRRFDDLFARLRGTPHRAGFAVHSLRAVGLEAVDAVLQHRRAVDPTAPVHIHVAEQPAEVEACRAALGAPPVRVLLDRFELDAAWCLVHATHAAPGELREAAARGAVVGLCPTTEANLGDGLFDLPTFLDAGGAFGVGSDSHVSVCPFEELRWLEYGQRLRTGRRNVVDTPTAHVGTNLWRRALAGGAAASGQPLPRLEVGAPADLLVFEDEGLAGVPVEQRLDVLIFGGRRFRPTRAPGGA